VRFVVVALLAVLALQPAVAQDAKASEESVKRLFEVMHTSQMLDSIITQMDASMRLGMGAALRGQEVTPDQQKIIDEMRTKVLVLVKDDLNWPSMRPTMVQVYRNTFSQREVDDMLKFYGSPSGQAVVAKLPLAMQRATDSMRERIGDLAPKIAQLQKDAMSQLKAAQESPQSHSLSGQPPQSAQPPPAHE
jgi:hypothetical protein